MKIRKGEWRVRLPERVDGNTLQLHWYDGGDPERNPNTIAIMVCQTHLEELLARRRNSPVVDGFPVLFALISDSTADFLGLYPTPDQELFAQLRYSPAPKVI